MVTTRDSSLTGTTSYDFHYPGATNTYPIGIDSNNIIYGQFDLGSPASSGVFRMALTQGSPTYTDLSSLFVNVSFITVTGIKSNRAFCGDYRTGPLSKFYFVNEVSHTMNEQNYGVNPRFPSYSGAINDSSWICGYYIDGVMNKAFVWKGAYDYDVWTYPGQNRTVLPESITGD